DRTARRASSPAQLAGTCGVQRLFCGDKAERIQGSVEGLDSREYGARRIHGRCSAGSEEVGQFLRGAIGKIGGGHLEAFSIRFSEGVRREWGLRANNRPRSSAL